MVNGTAPDGWERRKMLDSRGLAASAAEFLPEDVARALLEQLRWPDGPVCPHCGSVGAYRLHPKAVSARPVRSGVLKCKACRRQFSVTVGTAFESSHVPLNKWLRAIAHLCRFDHDLTTVKFCRLVGVSRPSGRFLFDRVREVLSGAYSRESVRAARASPPHQSEPRALLAYTGRLEVTSAASSMSRLSGKSGNGWTDRRRSPATEDGIWPGRVSFEEVLAKMMGLTPLAHATRPTNVRWSGGKTRAPRPETTVGHGDVN
jgi:transposase-like protein